MKNLLFKSSPILLLLFLFACENSDDSKDNELYVKFENASSSTFEITSIQTMLMGESGLTEASPSGEWSTNLLESETTLKPGSHQFFTLKIPNRHYCQYRLTVLDENMTSVILHEQTGYNSTSIQGTITHWGSDERTVQVTVQRNNSTNRITVVGYSDFAGIED